MTIEELKEAYRNGATIQFRLDDKGWTDWENPKFDCLPSDYRIKPKYHSFKDCNDKPPCRTEICASGLQYHISNKVVNQNGNVCWYNYKYDKWCFERGFEEEVLWWKEIE